MTASSLNYKRGEANILNQWEERSNIEKLPS